jgi:hypothetical protein
MLPHDLLRISGNQEYLGNSYQSEKKDAVMLLFRVKM